MSESKDTQPHKINIAVENFGPIEKAEIDLRPLTIFVGESNTGKTYLAALIYALQRAFEGIPRLPWLYYNTSQFNPIYHSQPADLSNQIVLQETQETQKKLADTGQPFKFSDLPKWVQDRLKCGSAHSEMLESELKRHFGYESISEMVRFTKDRDEVMKISFEVQEENQTLWSLCFYDSGTEINIDKYIYKDIVFGTEDRDIFQRALNVKDKGIPLRFLMQKSATSYYLPAARSGLMETRGIITSSLIDLATHGGSEHFTKDSTFSGMIADFLKFINNYEEREIYPSEIVEVSKTLENKVLQGEIEASQPAEVGDIQFRYRPLKSEKSLRISQTSSMISELTPLVLLLRSVVFYGDTLIIEEPESHLHPRAQTQIAITLARLVRAGVRVIITTHSDWLLQQIGNLIREGELKKHDTETSELPHWLLKEEVGAWWFHTDKPVEEIPFDRIEGIEPRDYEDVADNLYNSFVDFERQFLNEKAESEDG